MYQGEKYEQLKQEAKEDNFVYDLTTQRHDLEKLMHDIETAWVQADMSETRFCIDTKQIGGEHSEFYWASSEAFKHIKKAYHSLQNDLRRINK